MSRPKKGVLEPRQECVQMIIEVVSGKAGERKVEIDGVKDVDRSLWGTQKKSVPWKGNLFTLSPIHGTGKTQQIINSCQGYWGIQ